MALALLWALSGRITADRGARVTAYAVALTFMLWPGVVFRSATIGNLSLELPLSTAAILALWIAWNERSRRALVVGGVLCGLGLLCRLPFPPVLLLPLVAWRLRDRPRSALLAVVLPVLMLAPWVLLNLHRYGELTATSELRMLQGGFFNPGDRPYGLHRLLDADLAFLNGLLPEEWVNTRTLFYFTPDSLSQTMLHVSRVALVVLVAVPVLIWVFKGPHRLWLLLAPLPIALVLTQVSTVLVRLPLVQPRYLYPVLPAFGLLTGFTLHETLGFRRTAIIAGVVTVAVVAFWVYLSTVPPVTSERSP